MSQQEQSPEENPEENPVYCARHEAVEAITNCNICGSPVCEVCDFVFDIDHACPDCIASSNEDAVKESSGSKPVTSLVLAGVSSLLFGIVVIASATVAEESFVTSVGCLFLLVFVTGIAGTVYAFPIRRAGYVRSTVDWVAIVWNLGILAAVLLLTILGLFTE
jgi:hypothetical protein